MAQVSRRFFIVMMLMSCLFSGCVVALVGMGAAGGYAISEDEVEGFTNQPFETVWAAAEEVLQKEGSFTLQKKEAGLMKADVKGSEVKVTIEPVTSTSLRVLVKARNLKGLFPDIKCSQDIFRKILKKLYQA